MTKVGDLPLFVQKILKKFDNEPKKKLSLFKSKVKKFEERHLLDVIRVRNDEELNFWQGVHSWYDKDTYEIGKGFTMKAHRKMMCLQYLGMTLSTIEFSPFGNCQVSSIANVYTILATKADGKSLFQMFLEDWKNMGFVKNQIMIDVKKDYMKQVQQECIAAEKRIVFHKCYENLTGSEMVMFLIAK